MPAVKNALTPDIVSEIREAMRARLPAGTAREDMSIFVASALWLDRGIYPSGQNIRMVTDRGSLADIQRDLSKFWDNLRERVRGAGAISGIPPEFQEAAGRLVAEMWAAASRAADLRVDEIDADARRRVDKAESAAATATDAASHLRKQLNEQRLEREVAETENSRLLSDLRRQIADLNIRNGQLEVQVDARSVAAETARQDVVTARRELEDARVQFARDLEQEREDRRRDADDQRRFVHEQIDAARQEAKLARRDADLKEQELVSLRHDASRLSQKVAALESTITAKAVESAQAEGRIHNLEKDLRLLRFTQRKRGL